MKNNKSLIGAVAISIAAIMWGFDGVVLTPRLFNLNVSFVVFILHLIPFVVMNTFLFKHYKYLKSFSRKDFATMIAIALTGGALGTLAIVKALFLVNFQELSVVVLLQKLQPIFAIILAAFLLKERITKRFIFFAFIAIIAGYTLTFGFNLPNIQTDANTVYSVLYALLAAFCFGSSTVFSKMMLDRYRAKTITFYRYGFTTLIMLVVVIVSGVFSQFQVATTSNWIFFVIIGLTTGSGAIFLYYYGLNQVKAIVSVIIELLFPISAIVFDYIFNDSKFTLIQWLSTGIMLYAILKLNARRVKT